MFKKKSGARTRKNWSGYSTIELVVVIAIMAIMAAILTPFLIQYTEKSRAQRDASATGEATNAVNIIMVDQDAYNEIMEHSRLNNVSCYIDTPQEEDHSADRVDGTYSYWFGDLARQEDETIYFTAGNMRGVTITFEPTVKAKGSVYVIADGVVNKFVPSGGQNLSELPNFCSQLQAIVGEELEQVSQTYRYSEYTIFINVGYQLETATMYGQYSGTNLDKDNIGVDSENTTDRLVYDEEDIINGNGYHEQCKHVPTLNGVVEVTCANEGYTGDVTCVECGKLLKAGEVLPIVDHVGKILEQVDPTCTEDGYTGNTYCQWCGLLMSEGEIIPAMGHILTIADFADPTCEQEGYTGNQVCGTCGETIVPSENIPALGHKYSSASWTWDDVTAASAALTCDVCGRENVVGATVQSNAIDATCESSGEISSTATITVNGTTYTDSKTKTVEALGHSFETTVIPPSCTKQGSIIYECTRANCGYTYTEDGEVALGHKLGPDATCTMPQVCTTCGAKLVEAKGHVSVNGGTEKTHKKCEVCGKTLEDEEKHTYKSSVAIAATCTTKGTTKYSCDCGYNYTSQDIPIDPNNHTGSETNGGSEDVHTEYDCCGETISEKHVYTNKITTAATCKAEGVKTYTCTCGHSYTESIAKIPHTEVDGGTKDVHKKCSVCGVTLSTEHSYTSTVSIAATCATKGTTKYTCECGYNYTDQNVAIDSKNHTGSEINGGTKAVHTKYSCCGAAISATHSYTNEVTKAATCSEVGIRTYKCSCGYSYTEEIPMTEHTEVEGDSADAHIKCEDCGEVLSSEHKYTSKVTKAETCAAEGVKTYTCDCGYTYTEAIAKMAHTEVNGGTEKIHKKCSVCGATISATHSYTSTITTAATCTNAGVKTYTCGCGYSYTESIAASGHTTVNGGTSGAHTKCGVCGSTISSEHSYTNKVTTAATCTATGIRTYTCGCGYSYTESIAKTGHTAGADATCTSAQTCTVCGAQLAAAKGHTSVNGGTNSVHTKCGVCGVTISSTHSYTNVATSTQCRKCSCGYIDTTHTSVNGGTSSAHTKCSDCGYIISTGHSYSSSTTSYATCTSTGTTKYTCACGYSYSSSYGPNGHSSTSGGTSGVHSKCSVCGTTLSSTHSYSSSTKAATCTADGSTTYSCGCGYSYTSSIPKTGHSPGAAATCETAQTCKTCGATIVGATGHNYAAATCTEPKTCTKCGGTTGEKKGHNYSDATCTEPQTCSRCGNTKGEKLGHSYSAATCTTLQTCSRCGKTKGELASHNYSAATCTSPKTCSKCGATSGSKLGHSYSSATCTKPKTCSTCGATSGSALGHEKGASATCTIAQTCTRCSYVYQKALGHRWIENSTTNKTTCSRCGLSYET